MIFNYIYEKIISLSDVWNKNILVLYVAMISLNFRLFEAIFIDWVSG